jgi:4'-phosphopantetheinyl transferase
VLTYFLTTIRFVKKRLPKYYQAIQDTDTLMDLPPMDSLSNQLSNSAIARIKEPLTLTDNEIHLWITKPNTLAVNDSILLDYCALLTPAEKIKQQRYKFAKDRHDALITRAFIRDLLSYYENKHPTDWQFERGEKGKPEVINCKLPLRFNLSHTKDIIICAVTINHDIGCDVENTHRKNDVLSIAERYFSSSEANELFSLAKLAQVPRFFDYWTLKEAYIKAWGLGLSIPLKDFSFSIADKAYKHNSNFLIKNNINLDFAVHRDDNPSTWRNWLIYPTKAIDEKQQHRIALSLRAKKDNQNTHYTLRFFNSLPLHGYYEL